MPKVSVIVPNYNHAEYLPLRIDSILKQTFTDFELILLDDKSTDDSDKILKEYADTHHNIQYIPNQENSGSPFHQWNKGAELANGEYLWIAESDDFCEPKLLEQLVPLLEENKNVGIAYGQSWLVNEEGEKINSYGKNLAFIYKTKAWEQNFIKKGADANREWFLFHNPIPNASGALIRKEAFLGIGKADVSMKLNGDWYVYAQIMAKWDLAFCADHLNYFRVHTHTQRSRLRKTASIYHEIIKLNSFIRSNTEGADENADKALKKVGNWWIGSLPVQKWSSSNFKSNLKLFKTFRKHKKMLVWGIVLTYFIVISKSILTTLGLKKPVKDLRSRLFPGKILRPLMSFFSVIIPVYNAESTLGEILASLENQTFRDFETVFVNDGSIDNSLELIKLFKEENKDLQIKIIEQANKGLGASRNIAVEQCSGEYVCFLDADDYWHKDKLQKLSELIGKSPAQFVYHSVLSFGLGQVKSRFCYPVRSLADLIKKGNPIVPSAVCLERDLALKHPFSTNQDYHGAEDLLLWSQLLSEGHTPIFLNQALTYYRESGGMSTDIEDHYQKVFNVLQHLLEQQIIDTSLFEAAERRKHYEAARFYQKRRHFAKAEAHYKKSKSFGLKPWLLRLTNFLGLSI